MRQLILDLLPEERPSFENFVAGSNAEALTGSGRLAGAGQPRAAVLLWGEAGAGKSHLLQASEAAYTRCAAGPRSARLSMRADTRQRHAVDNVEALSASGQIACST
jgi:DnaA family protein